MRKCLHSLAVVVAATALSGCAVHSFRTTGAASTSAAAAAAPAAIVLRYEPQMPQSMSMRTAGLGAVYNPTVNDRLAASGYAVELAKLMHRGFKDKFPQIAKARGLTVLTSPAQDPSAPVLVVKVEAVKGFCSAWGCKATLVMHGGTLRKAQDKGWAFASEVGQASNQSKIDDEIFEAFAKEMLDAMERDGVVRGRAT